MQNMQTNMQQNMHKILHKICNKYAEYANKYAKYVRPKNTSSLSQNMQNMQQICKICKSKFNMQNMHSPLCWCIYIHRSAGWVDVTVHGIMISMDIVLVQWLVLDIHTVYTVTWYIHGYDTWYIIWCIYMVYIWYIHASGYSLMFQAFWNQI